MKLEIDIPEEMLEKEILDAVISVNTNNKTIKKVHIEPRVDDNKKVLDKMLVLWWLLEGRKRGERMTREEAINIIKSECYIFNPLDFDKSTMVNTALDIAIEALEKQDRIAQVVEDILDKLIESEEEEW